jgi:hypothetical protein
MTLDTLMSTIRDQLSYDPNDTTPAVTREWRAQPPAP